MALSYIPATRRQPRSTAAAAAGAAPLLLALCSSAVGALAMLLAFAGATARLSLDRHAPVPVALNAVTAAAELEPALEGVVDTPPQRRRAAQSLLAFVQSARLAHGPLPNVGALAAATHTDGAAAGQRLFTAAALARVKPHLVVRSSAQFQRRALVCAAGLLAAFLAVIALWHVTGRRYDVTLLSAVQILTALGFALLVSRADPLRDVLLFERYTAGVVAGVAVMAVTAWLDFARLRQLEPTFVPLALALGLSAALLLFGDGPGTSGAKVNLGPLQPIEAIRLLLALFLAGYFARRWELLRQIRVRTWRQQALPAWLDLPRADYVLPVAIGVASALIFFFLQKDLGPALFLSCVFLAMYAVARGRAVLPILGLALLGAGFYAGYTLGLSPTLAARVEMWRSPWDNAVRGGAQVAEALWALASGATFGTGLGLGDIRYLPAGHTDLVLAEVGEELGAIGLLSVAALYALIARQGFRIARRASSDYGFFLATALTLFLLLPVLMMAAGILGLTPLTGVVTPFLSYGGSAMVANFAGLGLLLAIDRAGAAEAEGRPATEPFARPLRWLTGSLAVAAGVLLLTALHVQVLAADRYATRGHLTVQADGVRRYQYNERLLDVAASLDRGTVFDRSGRVLATGDAALAARARRDYADVNLVMNASCLPPIVRCYPLNGMAFHLLGNATTRTNWGAPNSSYIERDAAGTLRGFDDRAVVVPAAAAATGAADTVMRDYSDLLPLLRHRYDRDHAAVQPLLARSRDARLTIDSRLQLRVAEALSRFAARSPGGHAAAVVLDASSGELLAAASYPWPAFERDHVAAPADALLDRARYGLYPPGSTFKLVTAAAAMRRDGRSSAHQFTCERLDDRRVGVRLRHGGRPIRDDVKDTHPHGTIDMHDGLVVSCNAYFAQLALEVGPDTLRDTAERLGISVATDARREHVRQTLPQAGYGQGEVVATPLKMARVAALFANGGRVVPVHWLLPEREAPTTTAGRATDAVVATSGRADHGEAAASELLLAPEAAHLIGQFMRDAVLDGTGRGLKGHPGRIAGKTGTAEVAGAPSHSWFAGYAPHGGAGRRIAFAIVVEHAGYGSSAAVPIAGDITSAALDLGLIAR